MFSVLAAGIYGMFEKRIKNKRIVSLCYFLTIGLIWAAVTLAVVGMSFARDIALNSVDSSILYLAPLAGFVLGLIFALFSWITGLRDSGGKTE